MATVLKLKVDQLSSSPRRVGAVKQVAKELKAGEVVIIPTETVYGLAANAFNTAALRKIFEIKKRPTDKPLAILISDVKQLAQLTPEITPLTLQLAQRFWPGPLTLVVQGSEKLPSLVRGRRDSVGVRCPEMELTRLIIEEVRAPLAATSANFSGSPSPTKVLQIDDKLADLVALVVDGGPAEIGVESTVLDLTTKPPRIIRSGAIEEEVEKFLKTV